MTSALANEVATNLELPEFLEDAAIVRRADGTRNAYGEWLDGVEQVEFIQVASAPTRGDVRETLPEGLRSRSLRTFWLAEPVHAVVEGKNSGDIIRYDRRDYRVIRINGWGAFSEAIGVAQEAEA